MTKDEAMALRTFKNHCSCGGYANTINGRPDNQPHMTWCPQFAEYAEWCKAMHSDEGDVGHDE